MFAISPSTRVQAPQRSSTIAFNKKGNKKTKVVLTANVPKIGQQGELLSVQNGFVTNYLVPQGLARIATKEILAEVQAKIEEEARQKAEIKNKAKAMATALQTIGVVKVANKVGANDQIFGSVKPSDITDFIERQTGQKLDASKLELPEIKTLGTYDAAIKLHPEVVGTFKVQVTKAPN
eukprot:jgi/Ulvmu1/9162/UM005_0260.1